MRNLNAAYKTFKNSSVKKQCYKNAFFMFCFPETQQTRNVFQEARFLYLGESKKHVATSNNPNRESYEKNCSETRSEAETGRFYVKLLMFICTSSYAYAPLTQPRSFLAGTLLSLLLDIDTSRSLFISFFISTSK